MSIHAINTHSLLIQDLATASAPELRFSVVPTAVPSVIELRTATADGHPVLLATPPTFALSDRLLTAAEQRAELLVVHRVVQRLRAAAAQITVEHAIEVAA